MNECSHVDLTLIFPFYVVDPELYLDFTGVVDPDQIPENKVGLEKEKKFGFEKTQSRRMFSRRLETSPGACISFMEGLRRKILRFLKKKFFPSFNLPFKSWVWGPTFTKDPKNYRNPQSCLPLQQQLCSYIGETVTFFSVGDT
jgi:hypothetical protein